MSDISSTSVDTISCDQCDRSFLDFDILCRHLGAVHNDTAESIWWPVGTKVSWPYRGTHGHGVIAGIDKKGKTHAKTRYKIREQDHHPGEPAIVLHWGAVLSRRA